MGNSATLAVQHAPTHEGVLGWLDASEPSFVFLHLPANDFHGIVSATTVGIDIVCGV